MMKTWQRIRRHPELLDQYLIREQVMDGIRQHFKAKKFHEVETPLMVAYPGTEPFLEVFDTQLQVADGRHKQAYFITSPEFSLKKLLAAGVGNLFQICRVFRNGEGISSRHNAEFTMIEWYRAEADYRDIMQDCEELLVDLLIKVKELDPAKDQLILNYQGREFDLTPPWPRLSVAAAFEQYAGISTGDLLDEQKLLEIGKNKGYKVEFDSTWEQIYNQIFLNEIETKLAQSYRPTIIFDYPVSQAALSRRKKEDPRFAERFEFYLAGLELGNAFSELIDPVEQSARIKEDLTLRKKLGKKEYGMDQDFIDALAMGMPESSGIAVGIDRLVMLLADVPSINDTMFFPGVEVFDLVE
jgi:lysyl-tRNA synthetase class 2